MKAKNKKTGNVHSVCPVLCGFQVCMVPNEEYRTTSIENIKTFLDEKFYEQFDLILKNHSE